MPGRRRSRGGFDEEPHGHGPRGGPRGGHRGPFRGGRLLADGDLRLIVLALLAEQPRHGYDIIRTLEERSSGAYSPSPGVVYPTLTFLEEAGYVTSASEGNKKVYAMTEDGRAHLEANRDAAERLLQGMVRYGERMARARDWFDRADEDAEMPGAIAELNQARRALKRALAERFDATEAEQRRIAGILERATAAIREAGHN
jgi:DNA-binding PadR family transcriptional regulator